MKKILIICLSVLMALSVVCLIGCNNKNSVNSNQYANNINVVDEIVGVRGQMCELPLATAVINNESYTVLVKVTDEKNNEIAVTNNSFYMGNGQYEVEYYVVVNGVVCSKKIGVTEIEKENKSTIIIGKLEYWTEPGSFDFSTINVMVKDYYGNEVESNRLSAKLVDKNGEGVNISNGFANLELGKYSLKYIVDEVETVNAISIFVSEKEYDDKDRLIFADFARENDRSLFASDYEVAYQNFNGSIGLVKDWSIRRKSWEIIFVSNGFVDFKYGGVVSFKTAILWQNVDCKINYYPADGGPVQVLGDFFNLGYYEGKELSFNVPEGGTLVGARLEFVLPGSEIYGHSFYDVAVDTNQFSFESACDYVVNGGECNVSDFNAQIIDLKNNLITENVEYLVNKIEGDIKTPVQVVDGKFNIENGNFYELKANIGGTNVKGTIKIYAKDNLTTNTDGNYEYMTMTADNTADQYMFKADYDGVVPGNLDFDGTKYGLQKAWDNGLKVWSYTFLTNGNLDYSKGATVHFNSTIAAWTTTTCIVTLTRTNGTQEVLANAIFGNWVVDNFSFTLSANEQLKGCKITFETPDSSTMGHCFGNVIIELPKPIEYVTLNQNAQGQYEYMILSDGNTADLSRIKIFPSDHPTCFVPMTDKGIYGLYHNCNADWDVASWTYTFNKECSNVDFSKGATVYFDCCLFNDVATSIKLIRANGQEESLGELLQWQAVTQKFSFKLAPNESIYGIKIAFEGGGWSYVVFNNVLIELPKPIEYVTLNQNAQGQYEYMILSDGNTADLSRIKIFPSDHPTCFVPMTDKGIYGLYHNCNADWDVASWTYTFNKECSNVDFSKGATVYFDCCLFNDVATSVKIIRANGQEESLGELLQWQTSVQRLSFKLAPNESLYGIKIAFTGGGWSYVVFNNVLIEKTKPTPEEVLTVNSDGKYEYMVLSEGSLQTASRFTSSIGTATATGLHKYLNDYATTWSYEFNTIGSNVDFSKGVTVTFDIEMHNCHVLNVKLIRANGQEQTLGELNNELWSSTFSFELAPNESLVGCKIVFTDINATDNTLGETSFNNVLIEEKTAE